MKLKKKKKAKVDDFISQLEGSNSLLAEKNGHKVTVVLILKLRIKKKCKKIKKTYNHGSKINRQPARFIQWFNSQNQ